MSDLKDQIPLGELAERMGIAFETVEPGLVVATMPVDGNRQPYGLLHGGASAVIAETVGSVAAALHAGMERIAVGIELSCTHHRAVRDGFVRATATPLHEGGSIATYDIIVEDDQGQRICTARLTCAVRKLPPAR
jgi:1,4-dihydroxy-2-naphthoyl-CoA hydrolase